MNSPVEAGFGGHRCRSKATPVRKTPSRWCAVTSPLPIYTSTPLNSPRPSCRPQLEWEATGILGDSKVATPLGTASPAVGTPGRSLSTADGTPTAVCSTPVLRRRINRRILGSTADEAERTPTALPSSPVSLSGPRESLCAAPYAPRPARYIQRQRAMVKGFMVTKKKLSRCKILNDNRGGLRL